MVASTNTLVIKQKPTTGMYEIIRTTGGPVHVSIGGMYTSTSMAQKAIDFYKANIEKEMEAQDLAKEKREYKLRAQIKEEKRIAAALKEEKPKAAKKEKTKPGKK